MSNALNPISGTPVTFTPSLPAQQVTVGNVAAGNPNFVRSITLSNEAVRVRRGNFSAFIANDVIAAALAAIVPQLTYPPLFADQPENASCVATFTADFTVLAAGEFDSTYPISYQWAFATPANPTSFTNTTDGGIYSGSTTNHLIVTPPDISYNGYIFICIATNAAGQTISTGAVLTVT